MDHLSGRRRQGARALSVESCSHQVREEVSPTRRLSRRPSGSSPSRQCRRFRVPEHSAEFIVSVNTGMRLSEQYSLTWGQVHLDRRTIDLTKTKNGSARTVHLNADAVAALKTLHMKATKPSDMVFPRQGPRFDTRSWFVPSLGDAKISGYVWHSNRHTFCSWLAMAGASIKEIQELAGHKTITMSARYSHLSPEHRLSVIDRISSPQQG
jgi:integrase